ncbi:MAG TPA: UDP-glucose/GDP-mannose dehydrogenase family protein [Terriglobales bacterium]|nr:UDP-glucose/GDP-mannose dehydrogenase family protein [Terriglobales bacterium]
MELAVIGCGYVGLVSSACLAEIGHDVICVDSDEKKIAALEGGDIPIHERFVPELLQRHHGRRLTFSTSLAEAVERSSVVFIAVGTPAASNGEADLSYVEEVARGIAHSASEPRLIVEKSTVPVYTCEWIRQVSRLAGKQKDIEVVSNPEFLREGTAVTDFLYPDRIILGADSQEAAATMKAIYAPLTSGQYYQSHRVTPWGETVAEYKAARLIVTSTKSAELIKHAANAFLAAKISFINAVANLCEAVGADIAQVCEGIGSDTRIGSRFLQPGIGYGGSCFPKDVKAFRTVAKESGFEFRLLDEVARINEEQIERFARKVRNALWNLKGKRIAALGLAFKTGTDDIRESPAIALIQRLLKEGSEIRAYDPAAMQRAAEVLPSVRFFRDAYAAARGADAILILTDWPELANLNLKRLRSDVRQPIVIDGRNLYSPQAMAEAGFFYHSVGRESVAPLKHTPRTQHPALPDALIRHIQSHSERELEAGQEAN